LKIETAARDVEFAAVDVDVLGRLFVIIGLLRREANHTFEHEAPWPSYPDQVAGEPQASELQESSAAQSAHDSELADSPAQESESE
jgi:hypothetical protein